MFLQFSQNHMTLRIIEGDPESPISQQRLVASASVYRFGTNGILEALVSNGSKALTKDTYLNLFKDLRGMGMTHLIIQRARGAGFFSREINEEPFKGWCLINLWEVTERL